MRPARFIRMLVPYVHSYKSGWFCVHNESLGDLYCFFSRHVYHPLIVSHTYTQIGDVTDRTDHREFPVFIPHLPASSTGGELMDCHQAAILFSSPFFIVRTTCRNRNTFLFFQRHTRTFSGRFSYGRSFSVSFPRPRNASFRTSFFTSSYSMPIP